MVISMSIKRTISLMLVFVMVLAALPFGPPASASSIPSNWAVEEMNDANTTGLLTAGAAKDFHRPLTRDEFCELIVTMVERTLGKTLEVPATNPFVDDVDPISIHALKAWRYEIITGITNTRFSPNNKVERQQLCTMMIRAIRKLEGDLNRTLLVPGTQSLPYRDNDLIRPYALSSVRIAHSNEIMQGNTQGYFHPRREISSEECVAVIIRAFNRIESLRTPAMTTPQMLSAAENRIHIGYAYGDTANGVTQNITLPLTSTGNATVTWVSSNSNVISISGATGIVNAGSYARSVILTATIRIGSSTRYKDFHLTTSQYSGDRLLVENAHQELDIVYINPGDSASSVTGKIGLPTSVLGLPVTWRSSNTSVISALGDVNVPSGSETRTVTMTATITSGSRSSTKVFTLVVMNPSHNSGVTLHNVQFGMTPSQVTSLLGSARRTIAASNSESWQIYHGANYANFIAVAFIGNRAVAVFSMASGVANQLRNRGGAVITVAQADALSGVNAASFTDPGNSSHQYAIMISESSSVIGSPRTLTNDGQEQLLYELINAFRVRNNRNALEWTPRLGTPARAHSGNRGAGSLEQRVVNGGYDALRFRGGNTVAGAVDAFDALRQIVNSSTGLSAMRTQIMQPSLTLLGTGYSGGHSGAIATYITYALGDATIITGVTASQNDNVVTTVNVGTGASSAATITLTMTPTGFNETFDVSPSNNRITVTNIIPTDTGATITVTGISNGQANIVVTGKCSGKQWNIPVVVGTVYASGLTLSYMDTLLTSTTGANNTNAAASGSRILVLGTGDTLTIAAAPNVANANVEWARHSGNAASVAKSPGSNNGVVTAGNSAGEITLTARVQTGAHTHITHTITVRVIPVSALTLTPQQISIGGTTTANVTVTLPTGASAIPAPNYTWASSGNQLTLTSPATDIPAVFTGANRGQPTVTFTASWAGTTVNSYLGRIVRTANVTVEGHQFADGIMIIPDTIRMYPGQTLSVQAVTVPEQIQESHNFLWSVESGTSASVADTGANGATGRITANQQGRTLIRVTLSQGDGPARTAIVTVDVEWPEVIHIGPNLPMTVGFSPTFAATTASASLPANYSFWWTCDDTSLMTMSPQNGIATLLMAGEVTVTAELRYENADTGVSFSQLFTITN